MKDRCFISEIIALSTVTFFIIIINLNRITNEKVNAKLIGPILKTRNPSDINRLENGVLQ